MSNFIWHDRVVLEHAYGARLDALAAGIVGVLSDAGFGAKAVTYDHLPSRREVEIRGDPVAPQIFAAAVIEFYVARNFDAALEVSCQIYKEPVSLEFTAFSEHDICRHDLIEILMKKAETAGLGAFMVDAVSRYRPSPSPKHWTPGQGT